jgi:hypothetical protein
MTNLQLAVWIRRVVLVLGPQYYGEEQEMLRLAAKRLEVQNSGSRTSGRGVREFCLELGACVPRPAPPPPAGE